MEAVRLVISNKFLKFSFLISLLFIALLHFYINRTTLNLHYGKVFYKLGLECPDKRGLNKQLSYFQKAVFYDPNLTDAYYQLGIIYGKKGQNEKEFTSYKKVAALEHVNADAYFKVGRYYFEKGELDYALRYFLQSNRYKPGSHDTFHYMAQIYEKKQMYKDAVHYYIAVLTQGSYFSTTACERIWRISKIPGQYRMVLDKVYQIQDSKDKGQQKLWEQIDRYLRTDQVPEFLQKSEAQAGSTNDQP